MIDLKKFIKGYILGALITITLFVLASTAHCAVSKKQGNALGFVQYDTNPLMYLAGSLASGDSVSEVDGNLNLRISPTGTYMLYDEEVMFCGMPVDKFNGIQGEFVLTYERVAHRTVQGVGCHELLRVDALVKRREMP